MTPWEAAITAIVIANGVSISALGIVIGLHFRDVVSSRREQGNR